MKSLLENVDAPTPATEKDSTVTARLKTTPPPQIRISRSFFQALQIPGSIESLHEVTALLCSRLGYTGFILQSHTKRFASGDVNVFTTNISAHWRDVRDEFNIKAGGDTLVKAFNSQSAPILWRDAARINPPLFARARDYGLDSGISHFARGATNDWTVASFINGKASYENECALLNNAPITQLLTCHLHDAVMRICEIRPANAEGESNLAHTGVTLSSRERECLALAMTGKTALKISDVLGISRSTVSGHFQDARRKLGAENMAHAVALALANGHLRANLTDPL